MDQNKQKFINYLLENQALLFGEFTLKSGRVSPYFFNLGLLNSGPQISQLGRFYAEVIKSEWKDEFDIIFGPAYKGIPLSVAIVDSLYRDFQIDKKYSSNRKEMKTYADKSVLLGADIKEGDRLVLVDDVMTSGQTTVAAVELIKSIAQVEIVGLMIALDRSEKGQTGTDSAVREFSEKTEIAVKSVITIHDIIQYLTSENVADGLLPDKNEILNKLSKYLGEYGVV